MQFQNNKFGYSYWIIYGNYSIFELVQPPKHTHNKEMQNIHILEKKIKWTKSGRNVYMDIKDIFRLTLFVI